MEVELDVDMDRVRDMCGWRAEWKVFSGWTNG